MTAVSRLSWLTALLTALGVAASGVAALNCECVSFYLCDDNNTIITNGAKIFDVKTRIGAGEVRVFNVSHADCPKDEDGSVYMKCCKIPPEVDQDDSKEKLLPIESNQETDNSSQEQQRLCGTRGGSGVDGSVASQRIGTGAGGGGDTSFGEFPWMLALRKKTEVPEVDTFKCGASLIHTRVALTAAHCVHSDKDASNYMVRAGEYDISASDETLLHQDRGVVDILVPDNFNPLALYHDVALLHLDSPFELDDHIAPICLPEAEDLFDGERCIATGWGRKSMDADSPYSPTLRQVELNMVSQSDCQKALRKTRLGKYFLLDKSFVCAQGQLGADTCEGDGGSPLICPLVDDPTRWAQAGITAWGIGCGSGVPAVYASVARSRAWLDTKLLQWGYGVNDGLDVSPRTALAIEQIFNVKP